MSPRALLSLLFHADKALDLVETARALGVIERLDAGPVTLAALAEATRTRPLRLYKFLDGLESLGLVIRDQPTDARADTRYWSREPLSEAVDAVLGARSIERDRNSYPWKEIHGRLIEVLRGRLDTRFAWPPCEDDDVRAFEASMAAGVAPIIEAMRVAGDMLFGIETGRESAARCAFDDLLAPGPDASGISGTRVEPVQLPWRVDCDEPRWLDVGGGDGAVAAALLADRPEWSCDVFNLPAVAPLVAARARENGLEGRLGFVAGDFLRQPLPRGYDLLSFVRVLHDWPADQARALLAGARRAMSPGSRIVICEEFRTRDRLAVQFFWTYFLIGADPCVSRLREVEWYTHALTALGFTDVAVIPGAFDLITATR